MPLGEKNRFQNVSYLIYKFLSGDYTHLPGRGNKHEKIFRKLEHGRLCGTCSSQPGNRVLGSRSPSPLPRPAPVPALRPLTPDRSLQTRGQPPKPDHRRPLGSRGTPPSLPGSLRSRCDTLRWPLINQFTSGSLRFITLLPLAKQQLYLPWPRLQNFS